MMETRSASLAALREELAISSESVSDASLSQAMERALQAMVPSGQPLQGLQQQDVARLVLHRNLLGPPRAARAVLQYHLRQLPSNGTCAAQPAQRQQQAQQGRRQAAEQQPAEQHLQQTTDAAQDQPWARPYPAALPQHTTAGASGVAAEPAAGQGLLRSSDGQLYRVLPPATQHAAPAHYGGAAEQGAGVFLQTDARRCSTSASASSSAGQGQGMVQPGRSAHSAGLSRPASDLCSEDVLAATLDLVTAHHSTGRSSPARSVLVAAASPGSSPDRFVSQASRSSSGEEQPVSGASPGSSSDRLSNHAATAVQLGYALPATDATALDQALNSAGTARGSFCCLPSARQMRMYSLVFGEQPGARAHLLSVPDSPLLDTPQNWTGNLHAMQTAFQAAVPGAAAAAHAESAAEAANVSGAAGSSAQHAQHAPAPAMDATSLEHPGIAPSLPVLSAPTQGSCAAAVTVIDPNGPSSWQSPAHRESHTITGGGPIGSSGAEGLATRQLEIAPTDQAGPCLGAAPSSQRASQRGSTAAAQQSGADQDVLLRFTQPGLERDFRYWLTGRSLARSQDIVLNITHAIAMLFGFVRFCWTVPALCLQLPFWLMALGLLPMCAVPLWVILHRPHFHARHRASMMSGLRFVRNVYITFTMAHMARPCTFSAFGAIFLLALLPGTVTENMAEGNLLVRHLVGDVFGVLTLVVANQNWGLSRTCCQNLPKTGILGLFAPVVGSSWGSAVPCQQQVVAVQLLTAIVGPSLFAWRRERTMRQQFLRERRAKAAAKGKARAPAFVVLPPARRFGALSLRQRYAPAGHRSTTP